MEHRLQPGPLLDKKGDLCLAGYAYDLVRTYDRKKIRASRLRIKEWDYYLINDEEYGLALTVADNGYHGLLAVTILDHRHKEILFHCPCLFPFPLGKVGMPASSKSGDVIYKHKDHDFRFLHEGDKRHLLIKVEQTKRRPSFACDIVLAATTPYTSVVATPFRQRRHFYYNQKIPLLQAEGFFRLGAFQHHFAPLARAVLDWGRGVWPYHNTWYWSSLNVVKDGVSIGWNLGCGFGDTSKGTENMLFLDQEVHKLGAVRFSIPRVRHKTAFLSPWRITSPDGTVDLVFVPSYDRHEKTDIGLIGQNAHQVFGWFRGTIKVQDKTVRIDDLFGFAEKVRNKW